MTKRFYYKKYNKSKKRNRIKNNKTITKFKQNNQKTIKKQYKGGGYEEMIIARNEHIKKIEQFRRNFTNIINQIKINASNNNFKTQKNLLIQLFNENNTLINTLIPVTVNGDPVDKFTYKIEQTPIYNFVSPIIVIFDKLTNLISIEKIKELLNIYYKKSGNFNNLSIKYNVTPIIHETNKKRVNHIKMLLDNSNEFSIKLHDLSKEVVEKINELFLIDENNRIQLKAEADAKIAADTKIIADALAKSVEDAKILADKAIADKIIADKAISDKAISDKAIADKAIADKSIADKAIADKVISDKLKADKLKADKVKADKAKEIALLKIAEQSAKKAKKAKEAQALLKEKEQAQILAKKVEEEKLEKEAQILAEKQAAVESKLLADNLAQLNYNIKLPTNDNGYDNITIPEFWKPLFNNGTDLINIKNKFDELYLHDKMINKPNQVFKICDILETIVPGYFTRSALEHLMTIKTLVNMNILNCFTTLFSGIISYRLINTNQDYIFIFKGGRALQLSLIGIQNITKYLSEDTDLLIIPNLEKHTEYNLEKMKLLSGHIGYLIKWMIPQDIKVIVSLPNTLKNTNPSITKLIYEEEQIIKNPKYKYIFKPFSDIGFGTFDEDLIKYFTNFNTFKFNLESFNDTALFKIQTIDDMLKEKIYLITRYLKFKNILNKGEKITDPKYNTLTIEFCDKLIFKFQRAIVKLVESLIVNNILLPENNIETKRAMSIQLLNNIMNDISIPISDQSLIINGIYPSNTTTL